MAVRMSSNQFMYNYQHSLNRAYQKQTKLFEDADGSSLHRPSDNALDYSKLLRYQNIQNENEQYQRNVDTAKAWMQHSQSALDHISSVLQTFAAKSVDAANDHNNESDLLAISKEMMVQIQEIVATGNSQEGDRYIFSGQRDLTKPFTMSETLVDRGLAKTLDNAQISFFRGNNVDAQTQLTQMLTLEDQDGNYYYLDTIDGSIYTKEFMDEGYKDAVALGTPKLIDGDESKFIDGNKDQFRVGYLDIGVYREEAMFVEGNETGFRVSNFFDNRGVLRDDVDNQLLMMLQKPKTEMVEAVDEDGNPIIDDEGNPVMEERVVEDRRLLKLTTIKQQIVDYAGDDRYISMVKLNGAADQTSDTVNVTGHEIFGTDIFDDAYSGNEVSGVALLNQMLTVQKQVENAQSKWASSDGITIGKVASSTVTFAETRIGTRAQLYENVSDMLTRQSDNIIDDITNVSATDVAKLAMDLMTHQMMYNLSLSMGGRILPQTLADYL